MASHALDLTPARAYEAPPPAYERKDDPRPTVSFAKAILPGKDRWHSAVLTDVVSSHNLQNKKIILLL